MSPYWAPGFTGALEARLKANGGLEVCVGSRTPQGNQLTPADAVRGAKVVFLAVPASAHAAALHSIGSHLTSGTVLVDVSNQALCAPPARDVSTSIAERLREQVPDGIIVAMAFNTLSSYTLSSSNQQPPIVRIACDSDRAVELLSSVCVRAGLVPVKYGKLSSAVELEAQPHRLFPTWRRSLLTSFTIMMWWIFYNSITAFALTGPKDVSRRELRRLPFEVFLSPTGETCMTLLSLTFLASPIAGLIHLARSDAKKPFGRFIGSWLGMRKQLSVVAFFFACLHAFSGVVAKTSDRIGSEWMADASFTLGILSLASFAVLAVCTSPSVAESISYAEFRAVFSWLGTVGLVFGTVHQCLWGVIFQLCCSKQRYWEGHLAFMPSYWLGFNIPLVAILLRCIIWSPCAMYRLRGLRNEGHVDLQDTDN